MAFDEPFVENEVQRIYAEYKRQSGVNNFKLANDNYIEKDTVEAFSRISKSLVGAFVKA
ncbi:MAG: hypothetical protein LBB36_00090 [Fibromonadaceae bacterium]|jgi:hypothetical protein|nr:hypothetical protein [Fibromonadaceae bacterium]